MKTIVPFKLISSPVMLVAALIALVITTNAQTTNLVFKNPSYISGTGGAGNVGATYRFSDVANNIDALVRIDGRSNGQVRLVELDLTGTGFDNAFQPQITYSDGDVSSVSSWWMDFRITFVTKNTTTPVAMNRIYATALDVDGDNNRLHERVSFFQPNAWTLENPTSLSVSNLLQTVLGLLTNVGKTFDGTTVDHAGIDTNATNLMATMTYNNASSITYRAGGATTGASNSTQRNYSVYFKNFSYAAPVTSLPVKLSSFTATLNQKQDRVDLNWSTASEINVSHFTVERSYDGQNFTDAGVVFAFGNTTEKKDYIFPDKVKSGQPIIYYRLRSNDNDGKYEYSETRVVRIGKTEEMARLITYPNPVTDEVRITVPASWQGKAVAIELYTQNGQRMRVLNTGSASQTETIKVGDLSKGFYVLKASCGEETAQQKVIKQ